MPSIEQLQRLLDLEPGDSFLIYGIAQEHLKAGRFDEAVAWFDRTIEADADHCYAYYFKAKALEEAGSPGAALAAVDAGLANARRLQDMKAMSELSALRDELE
jgi:tetratricopeptide (TPR) repeat protein